MLSSTRNLSETIFDYLVTYPSSTTQEVSDGIGMDLQKCRSLMADMFKRGKLERKETINPTGYHKTVYRYWTTSTTYERLKTGRKPKAEHIEIPKSWTDDGIGSLKHLLTALEESKPPIEVKPTEDNTIRIELTINITAHRLILDVLQQMSKNL